MKRIVIPEELRDIVTHYLLTILEDEEADRFSEKSLSCISRVISAEKNYEWKRYGKGNAIRDWFLGLGMNVDFSFYDIANKMREWGFKVNEDDDDDYYAKCDLYWDILTQVVYDAA